MAQKIAVDVISPDGMPQTINFEGTIDTFNMLWGQQGYQVLGFTPLGSTAPTGTTSAVATTTAIPPPQPVLVQTASGQQMQVSTLVDLSNALDQGANVVRSDGSLGLTQKFMGGYLVDGHPLNVVLGQGWIVGQKEAVAAAVAQGLVPQPTAMLNAPVLNTSGDGFLMSAGVLFWPALGLGALYWYSRRKKK